MNVNLILLKNDGSQKVFALPSNITVIGRRPDCDLCIPLTSVSRRHCQLNYDQGVLKIRDFGSHNGTFLNGKRIENTAVQAGDSIKVGPLTFVLQINGQPATTALPDLAALSSPQQDMPTDDAMDELFDSFTELDELDSSAETGST